MARRSLNGGDRQINADAEASPTGQRRKRISGPTAQIRDDRRFWEIEECSAAGNRIDERSPNAGREQRRTRLDRDA
jgi:hypothetical protein